MPIMGKFSTVSERGQRNGGFLSGPNHRMLMAGGLRPAPEADSASPAPNYREGEPGHECRNCANYEFGARHCSKYDFDAKPLMVCDGFDAQEPSEPVEAPVGGPPLPPMAA